MPKPLANRFWAKVDRRGPAQCWPWKAAVNKDGYGILSINRRCVLATRVAFQLAKGPLPAGTLVCHTCDNPICVNPDHLYAGTPKSNARDCVERGRKASVAGEANPNARLTSDQVARMRVLAESGVPDAELACMFAVSPGHVGRILNGEKWA